MELVNLHDLMTQTQQGFNSNLFDSERTLPNAFKELVPDFDGTQLVYLDYTCVLVERTPGLNIVFPNQWFYIAAYMTDYYHMVLAYKQKVLDILRLNNTEKAKNTLRDVVGKEAVASSLFDDVNYHEADRPWLIKFITDYSWWGGGKAIDRGDFHVSPVLSLAHLVNASQSFVADICKFLAEHKDALDVLRSEISTFNSKSSLEYDRKAAFLKYFGSYLRLSTGKSSPEKIEQYLSLVDKQIYSPIKELHPDFTSVFTFGDKMAFNALLSQISKEIPSLDILTLDTWPKEKEQKTIYYEPWTFIRHYRNFLELSSEISLISKKSKPSKIRLTQITSSEIDSLGSYYRAMRTKPFLLLAGISGTGKSRIVKQIAFDSCPDNSALRSDLTSPGNYCLIEVKPNWHDSTELIGYESQIGKPHYQLTPFVKFLIKAMLHPETPFFVCLDEMNLAPVEQYFAEFLSVLESRTKIDGHIVSEPLIKKSIFANGEYEQDLKHELFDVKIKEKDENGIKIYEADLTTEELKVYEDLKEHGLRIPENVIVVGTVNMDETTHQFSRKVIDRAMTIEMNLPDGDPFMDFFANASDLAYRSNPTSPSLYLATETRASDVVKALATDNAEKTEWLKGEVAAFLTNLNGALENTPFKVAYRVQNELMLYFYQLWLEDKTAEWHDILNTSCDQILMMKVLPRVEGDEELLEKPIERLIAFCSAYPNASKKLSEMKERLGQSRFTSYWP
ncbi:MAG: hypothetical protein K2L55_06685 [Muribaculaceae bacterium]|nr:hypothetical protein [Muribaculaceae bacterium]